MADQQTLSVYDEKIDDYVRLTQAAPSRALLNFIEAIPKGGSALDLGCGPGFAAKTMAEKGLKVTATDASPEMAKAAAMQNGVTARCEDFDAIPTSETYDGIYANFSLLHASRDDFLRHIDACNSALHENGVLHLGLKTGNGEKRDRLGRHYTYYTRDELVGILTDRGFKILKEHQGEEPGLAGPVEPFILILAQKIG